MKHEAQHAKDLAVYPEMSPTDLEYRAKLVELIYSIERNLLEQFIYEADVSKDINGHALAANRIVAKFAKMTSKNLLELSIGEIQSISRKLLEQSNVEMLIKYSGK